MNVSIVTITQHKRRECMKITADVINDQTYKNIIEWVVVEGSPTEQLALENKAFLFEFMEKHPLFPIFKYIPFSGLKLGGLRNLSNQNASGDIIVCFDDDDYYFPTRVQHCVDKLTSSEYLLAGTSQIYIHDYILDKTFKTNLISTHGPYNTTNNAMAYKKEYLKNHCCSYQDTFSEEVLFTDRFQEPLEVLNIDHTIVLSSHTMNTYNKRSIFTNALLPDCVFPNKLSTYIDIDIDITTLIPRHYYERYKSIFIDSDKCEDDIVYFTGAYSICWNPENNDLGGSEQAVVNLCSQWAAMGKSVSVYGNFTFNDKIIDGVKYINWMFFPYHKRFKTLIVWRLFGLIQIVKPFKIKADTIILDLHDNMKNIEQFKILYKENKDLISQINVKSQYHLDELEVALGEKIENAKIIPNGVRIEQIRKHENMYHREPLRFVYASCYTRGLIQILSYVWPKIVEAFPQAELHLYYGMDNVEKTLQKKIRSLISNTKCVMDHGRRPFDAIIREKYTSSYHLYLCNSEAEIDCISVKESIVAGCIPILSAFGVFKERHGLVISGYDPFNENSCKDTANFIVHFIRNSNDKILNEIRDVFSKSDTIVSWGQIAAKWLE